MRPTEVSSKTHLHKKQQTTTKYIDKNKKQLPEKQKF